MAKIISIFGENTYPNVKLMLMDILEKHSDCHGTIVVVFEKETSIPIMYQYCELNQLALGSLMLQNEVFITLNNTIE